MTETIVEEILLKRGVPREQHEAFLNPDYDTTKHDPFLLPDMDKAVKRILQARDNSEQIVIYGDYDVDGMCATAILYDALTKFGLKVETYTPDRFSEGYGLNMAAMRGLTKTDAKLVITVDCGSMSHDEIDVANKLGLDVIVTDHHAMGDTLPMAVAVINPQRADSQYSFKDLAGCGVAFKLVQALQLADQIADSPPNFSKSPTSPSELNRVTSPCSTSSSGDPVTRSAPSVVVGGNELEKLGGESALPIGQATAPITDGQASGIGAGQEKWLLDLVALGTVCDIVPLLDENRSNVYWGIEVLKKTRRPGLKALIAVTKLRPSELNAHKIGFVLGPRLNAAGRIVTAKSALELLLTNDNARALELAQKLDSLNSARRVEQDKIFTEACEIIEGRMMGTIASRAKQPSIVESRVTSHESRDNLKSGSPRRTGSARDDKPVIIVGKEGWNEGVIGIVASKLMEKYGKPTFVLSIGAEKIKGSGRSFGDFNMAEAIAATSEYLEKGGGHAAAGGVALLPENYDKWRQALHNYYVSLLLENQKKFLTSNEDITRSDLVKIDTDLVRELEKLEPFGLGNERPVFRLSGMRAKYVDQIGQKGNHLKLTVSDGENQLKFLAFDPPKEWFIEQGTKVDIWVNLEINEWQGAESVEGRILRIELT